MGLYKDPDGKNITTFKSNTEKDNATVDKSTSGSEMKDLRRKVVELETSLKQYVRNLSLAWLEPTKLVHNVAAYMGHSLVLIFLYKQKGVGKAY